MIYTSSDFQHLFIEAFMNPINQQNIQQKLGHNGHQLCFWIGIIQLIKNINDVADWN